MGKTINQARAEQQAILVAIGDIDVFNKKVEAGTLTQIENALLNKFYELETLIEILESPEITVGTPEYEERVNQRMEDNEEGLVLLD